MKTYSLMKKNVLATLLMAAVGQAMAAGNSIDLKVTGNIMPPSCEPSISGGSTVDYGNISAGSLSKDSYTTLNEKSADFSLTCDSPTLVGVKVTDMRANSAEPMPSVKNFGFQRGATAGRINGLGKTEEGKNIGNYQVILASNTAVIDGNNLNFDTLMSDDSGSTWRLSEQVTNLSGSYFANGTTIQSWAEKGSLTPLKFTTLKCSLVVQANINKASELNLTKEIKLDGLENIEVVYL